MKRDQSNTSMNTFIKVNPSMAPVLPMHFDVSSTNPLFSMPLMLLRGRAENRFSPQMAHIQAL